MIEIFDTGIKFLVTLTSIFFLVLFFFCSQWAQAKHPEKKTMIGVFVSALFTFLFFLAGSVVVGLISLLPNFFKLIPL